MEVLRQMIREITVIVLMAGLFEMLLPDNQMKRFVKLILGLFIIVTLLGPVSSWIKDEKNWDLTYWNLPLSDRQAASTVLSPGSYGKSDSGASSDYQNHLAKQIESLLQMIPGVKQVEAKVYLRSGASFYSLDAISQVEVRVTREREQGTNGSGTQSSAPKTTIRDILPIEISTDRKTVGSSVSIDTAAEEMTRRVKETVSNFYGLPKERIQVEVV